MTDRTDKLHFPFRSPVSLFPIISVISTYSARKPPAQRAKFDITQDFRIMKAFFACG